MVYCGKPSRGCQNCKTRRIKCDETRPHCNNCKRTRRECPGYPAEFDLIFRSENPNGQKRTKKASPRPSGEDVAESSGVNDTIDTSFDPREATSSRKRRRKEIPGSDIRHDSATSSLVTLRNNGSSSNSINLPAPYMQSTFMPSIDEQATTFFFRNFLIPNRGNDPNASKGFLEVAAPLADTSGADSPVSLALKAIAIGIIANWPGRNYLAPLGARYYGRALSKIQKAIEDPNEATSDATLLSILLFSLYESVISNDHSPSAWSQHIEGAIAVVRARGLKQLQNPLSLLLFRATRTQMITHAIQSRQDIPDFPAEKGWVSDIDANDRSPGGSMVGFSVRLPRLLSRAKRVRSCPKTNNNPKYVAEVKDLLREAREVEQALRQWEKHIPAHWAYRSVDHSNSNNNDEDALDPEKIDDMEAWPGPMHIYEDTHVSSVRNNHRVNHMLCSTVVIDCIRWLEPEEYSRNETFQNSRSKICELVDDICYSVPFHLWGKDAVDKSKASMMSQVGAEAIGGYFLIWPLYNASTMEVIPPLQRRWLQARLWTISSYYGIDRNTITSSPAIDRWLDQIPRNESASSSSASKSTIKVVSSPSSPPTPISNASSRRNSNITPAQADNSGSSEIKTVLNNNQNNRDLTTLQCTKSIQNFVRATDMLLQMTRTMEIGPRGFVAGPTEIGSDGQTSGEIRSEGEGFTGGIADDGFVGVDAMAQPPGSAWQTGMWASLRTMLELMGVRT